MSRIRARTGSSPCEVSTTKSARLRFSASGSCRARMASSFSLGHVVARENSLALIFRRGRDHHHGIDAFLAAGLVQQRHIDHRDRRAGLLGVIKEFLPGGAEHRMDDLLQPLDRRGIMHHLRRQKRAIDLAVDRRAREMPLRWQAPPRLRIIDEPSRRRHRRERRPPRTVLRWSISPSRSSRSAQE